MLYYLLNILRDWLVEVELYRYVQVLDRISFRAFAAGVFSLVVVVWLGKPVIRWLTAKRIGDTGTFDVAALEQAMASKVNTPTMGGLLIAAAIGGATLLFADVTNHYVRMGLIVLLWMAALGGVDDWLKLTSASRGDQGRQGLRAWEKLVFQLGIGILIGVSAYSYGDSPPNLAHVLNLPFQKTFEAGGHEVAEGLVFVGRVGFVVIMTMMIAGMSNAVNMTDGMDGLASGITGAVSMGLFVLCLIAGWEAASQYLLVPYVQYSDELAVMAGAMAGACLGFLWWNCAPASVFMGDTGSLCLGGLLGYIAVVIRQEFLILVMSGVMLLELGSVAAQVGWFKTSARMYGEGQRIFRCAPYHWHLHMGGWSEQKIVARLWIVTVALCAAALASIKVR